jgi:alkylhydroperoxidase family enzyme
VARIRSLTKDEVSPEIAPLLDHADDATGPMRIPLTIQAYCPPILEASRALGQAPARSGLLPAELRALVCLRAAQMVGCVY